MDEVKNDESKREGENSMSEDFETESREIQEENFAGDDFNFDDISKAIGSEDFSLSEDGDDVIKTKEKFPLLPLLLLPLQSFLLSDVILS